MAHNIPWFEDSSNSSSQYHRGRIRIKLGQNEELKQNIILRQLEINKQASHLAERLIFFIAESVSIYSLGFATIDLSKFKEACEQVRFQLINFVLTVIGGKLSVPRASSTKILLDCISGESEFFVRTLHGCVVKRLLNQLLIYREFGKNMPQDVSLQQSVRWDSRFCFKGNESCLFGAYITHLTTSDYAVVKGRINLDELKEISSDNHLEILFTLPVIKILKKIIALPYLCYYNSDNLRGELDFSFSPEFISRFTHFC